MYFIVNSLLDYDLDHEKKSHLIFDETLQMHFVDWIRKPRRQFKIILKTR